MVNHSESSEICHVDSGNGHCATGRLAKKSKHLSGNRIFERSLHQEHEQKKGDQDFLVTLIGEEKSVLLHTCCAPCSSAIIEWMLANGITPTIYYCNPNIYPYGEYEIRKNECTRYARSLGLEIVDADYDHGNWLKAVAGLEGEPERGGRCLQCFRLRLDRTAEYASRNGFRTITTTLASSRWKSLEQINEAGRWAAARHEGVVWWDRNWRKGGLQERRNALIKEYGFYNQLYCGCEFSMPQDYDEV